MIPSPTVNLGKSWRSGYSRAPSAKHRTEPGACQPFFSGLNPIFDRVRPSPAVNPPPASGARAQAPEGAEYEPTCLWCPHSGESPLDHQHGMRLGLNHHAVTLEVNLVINGDILNSLHCELA